ncbi:MAG: glycoside hydrolase family 97 protein [Phycisphaerae bacterium]|nr:glycoside hydrolase family 97 protein [Phycisphaerae bacterium]
MKACYSLVCAALSICLSVPTAGDAEPVTIASPDGAIRVEVLVNDEGRLCYWVQRVKGSDTVILNPSALGITVDGVDLGQGAALGECRRTMIDERYPCRGVHSEAVNRCHVAQIDVTHAESKMSYVIEMRVFDDGLAYRYVVPGVGQRTISGEVSVWNLPRDCQVWYQTNVANYEGFYAKSLSTRIKVDEQIGFPVTIQYADGTYGAITEAGLLAFSGLTVRAARPSRLKGVFEDDAKWQETGEIRTPWRVTMTGPDLNALVNSDIVANLCPAPDANLFPDGLACAWIKPGRSLWNWWSDSSVEFRYQKEWVDKAAEMGFEYYLVDAGWEKSWQLPTKDMWACLKELCDYAKGKGVGINVWKHWGGLETVGDREDFLRRCAQAGAVGVKIDFMDSESRSRIDFYTYTLATAARNKLMVNYHGANKPTGESRTFPNEMTREGIRGLEYNKWSELPATHYATLPFTRYLAGHGDFTPCTFNPDKLKGTTAALQLASTVVFTSPLMHWADHWKFYLDSNVLEVIKAMPSTWDQTIVLPGSEIGQVAAFARRSGASWFVGIINGGKAQTHALDLSFLADGAYDAVLVRDVEGKPAEMSVERANVTKGQKLDVQTQDDGGFVAWLVPAK